MPDIVLKQYFESFTNNIVVHGSIEIVDADVEDVESGESDESSVRY